MNKSKKILSVALVILISGFAPFFNISSKSVDVENDLKNVYVAGDSKDDAKSGQKKKNNSIKGVFGSLAKKSNLLIYAPILAAVVGYGLWALDDKMLPDYENCEFNPKKLIEQARNELQNKGITISDDDLQNDLRKKTKIITHIASKFSTDDNFWSAVRVGKYALGNVLNLPLDLLSGRNCEEKMEQEVRRFSKSNFGLCFRYCSIICLVCKELNVKSYICVRYSDYHAYVTFVGEYNGKNEVYMTDNGESYYGCHLPFNKCDVLGKKAKLKNTVGIARLDLEKSGTKFFRDIVFYSPIEDKACHPGVFIEKVVDNEERSNSSIAYTETRLPLFFSR